MINTKTLMIYGTGRSGGAGGRGGRAGGGAGAGGQAQQQQGNPPQLYAIDKATGQQVAAVRIPQVNTAVPMTFMHKGKQYIVFAYGQGANTGLTALTLPAAPSGTRNGGAGGREDASFTWGPPNALPVAGDWNGDGRDSIGLYVPAWGLWVLRDECSNGPADVVFRHRASGEIPFVGRWS